MCIEFIIYIGPIFKCIILILNFKLAYLINICNTIQAYHHACIFNPAHKSTIVSKLSVSTFWRISHKQTIIELALYDITMLGNIRLWRFSGKYVTPYLCEPFKKILGSWHHSISRNLNEKSTFYVENLFDKRKKRIRTVIHLKIYHINGYMSKPHLSCLTNWTNPETKVTKQQRESKHKRFETDSHKNDRSSPYKSKMNKSTTPLPNFNSIGESLTKDYQTFKT